MHLIKRLLNLHFSSIDPRNPHAVNHMIVGDIGHVEILLASSDDGDVIAFTTNSIQQAIQDNVAGNTDIGCRLNAFFIENVGHSAWGLAIHKAARLIAVSANTHEITVFAFALGSDQAPGSGSEDEDSALSSSIDGLGGDTDWLCLEHSIDPPERSSRNIKVRLLGHETNIPSISFCNSDADPHGRYLLSTDIDGQTFVWDVWQKKRIGDLSKIGDAAGCPGSGGWGVACLDPKALRRTEIPAARFGRDASRSSGSSQGSLRDISSSVQDVPDSSYMHPAMLEFRSVPGDVHFEEHGLSPNIRHPHQTTLSRIWDTLHETWNRQNDEETDDEDDGEDDDEVSDDDGERNQEPREQEAELDEAVGADATPSGAEEPHGDRGQEPLPIEALMGSFLSYRRQNVASSIVRESLHELSSSIHG